MDGYSRHDPVTGETKFYDSTGRFTGSSNPDPVSGNPRFYDANGRYSGSSSPDPVSGNPRFSDSDGRYTGYSSPDPTSGNSRFYDSDGRYTGRTSPDPISGNERLYGSAPYESGASSDDSASPYFSGPLGASGTGSSGGSHQISVGMGSRYSSGSYPKRTFGEMWPGELGMKVSWLGALMSVGFFALGWSMWDFAGWLVFGGPALVAALISSFAALFIACTASRKGLSTSVVMAAVNWGAFVLVAIIGNVAG